MSVVALQILIQEYDTGMSAPPLAENFHRTITTKTDWILTACQTPLLFSFETLKTVCLFHEVIRDVIRNKNTCKISLLPISNSFLFFFSFGLAACSGNGPWVDRSRMAYSSKIFIETFIFLDVTPTLKLTNFLDTRTLDLNAY